MFQSIGDSLEIKEVVQTLTSAVAASSVAVSAAVGGDSTEAKKSVISTTSDSKEEIKVGMPNF
jgi:hypothetical protein